MSQKQWNVLKYYFDAYHSKNQQFLRTVVLHTEKRTRERTETKRRG